MMAADSKTSPGHGRSKEILGHGRQRYKKLAAAAAKVRPSGGKCVAQPPARARQFSVAAGGKASPGRDKKKENSGRGGQKYKAPEAAAVTTARPGGGKYNAWPPATARQCLVPAGARQVRAAIKTRRVPAVTGRDTASGPVL